MRVQKGQDYFIRNLSREVCEFVIQGNVVSTSYAQDCRTKREAVCVTVIRISVFSMIKIIHPLSLCSYLLVNWEFLKSNWKIIIMFIFYSITMLCKISMLTMQ